MKEIKYIRHQTIPSTNTWVKEHLNELDSSGISCVVAENQTGGRGQFNRSFICSPGNIYATFYFCTPLNASYLSNLSQLLSLSCAAVLKSQNIPCKLKWPNDLMVEGKKLGGVLCETVPQKEHTAVILGIGLNVNISEKELADLDKPATSLAIYTKKSWDEKSLLEKISAQFLTDLEMLQKEGFSAIYKRYCSFLSIEASMQHVHQTYPHATFNQITEEGRLCIDTAKGQVIIT